MERFKFKKVFLWWGNLGFFAHKLKQVVSWVQVSVAVQTSDPGNSVVALKVMM